MSSEDTLRSQIQAHSQELWNIVNKTISIPSESVSQESKFYKALTYNFDTLEEQKFAKIHEMIALDKPHLYSKTSLLRWSCISRVYRHHHCSLRWKLKSFQRLISHRIALNSFSDNNMISINPYQDVITSLYVHIFDHKSFSLSQILPN